MASSSSSPDGGWGWLIVAAAFINSALTSGLFLSFSGLYASWLEEFGCGQAVTSWIVSIAFFVTCGGAPIAASLTTRFGHRTVTMVGGLITCCALSISSFATSVEFLVVTLGLGSGFGATLVHVASLTCVPLFFRKRLSLAVGIATSGVGVGTFVLSPFLNWLEEKYGWRGALLVLGAVTLHETLVGMFFRSNKGSDVVVVSINSQVDIDGNGQPGDTHYYDDGATTLEEEDNLQNKNLLELEQHPTLQSNGSDDCQTPRSEERDKNILTWTDKMKCSKEFYLKCLDEFRKSPLEKELTRMSMSCTVDGTRSNTRISEGDDLESQIAAKLKKETQSGMDITSSFHPNNVLMKYKDATNNIMSTHQMRWSLVGLESLSTIGNSHEDECCLNGSAFHSMPHLECINWIDYNQLLLTNDCGYNNNNNDINKNNNDNNDIYEKPLKRSVLYSMNKCDTNSLRTTTTTPSKRTSGGALGWKQIVLDNRTMLRDTSLLLFAMSNVLRNISTIGPVLYMVDRVIGTGIDKSVAIIFVSVFGIANTIGRLAFGVVVNAFKVFSNSLVLYIVCLTVSGGATILSPLCGSNVILHGMYAAVLGILQGGSVSLLMPVLVDLVGRAKVTVAFGLVMGIMSIGFLLGPPTGGLVYDWSQSYSLTYIAHGVFMVIGGVILVPLVWTPSRDCCLRGSNLTMHRSLRHVNTSHL